SDFASRTQDSGFSAPRAPDPELVRQSIAVLRLYLAQAGSQLDYKTGDARLTEPRVKRDGNGHLRMSREQAFAALALAPGAAAHEIGAAHRRLEDLLDRQRGGTAYLSLEINEARDVLLGE